MSLPELAVAEMLNEVKENYVRWKLDIKQQVKITGHVYC